MLAWIVGGVALAVALAALGLSRQLSRKLDALNQSYWELRYEYTRLRAQVARLDPETPGEAAAPQTSGPETVAFVPLTSIRKKEQ